MTTPTPASSTSVSRLAPLTRLGRILFALPFLVFGIMHFVGAADIVRQYDVPLGLAGVYLSGAGMVLFALAVFVGRLDKLASLLLAVLLLVFILTLHVPAAGGEGQAAQLAIIGIFRDLGMLGAALMYAHLGARDARFVP